MEHTENGREFCYRCHKVQEFCLCQNVPMVKNNTPVFILQHFRERFHPIGTARIARLGLQKCLLKVAYSGFPANSQQGERDIDQRDLLTQMDIPEGTAVLFPSRHALPIEKAPKPRALLLLDATWSHAKRLYYENPWIHQLPHLSLGQCAPSRYQIRKEPEPHCVSTLEAIVHALGVLEPELEGLTDLLSAFDLMIERQKAYKVKDKG